MGKHEIQVQESAILVQRVLCGHCDIFLWTLKSVNFKREDGCKEEGEPRSERGKPDGEIDEGGRDLRNWWDTHHRRQGGGK